MQLTQKERSLLKDQLSHEEICIQKYNKYANQVQDPQLKQMLQQFASQEQQHHDTINQILQGQQPNLGGGQQQQQPQQKPQFPNLIQNNQANQQDAFMLRDLLMTEKYISGTYNTTIFETVNPTLRQALQHIQKEEQQHGEGLFNYMQQHGLYNPQ